MKALDIDAGMAAGARQARRYSLFFSVTTICPRAAWQCGSTPRPRTAARRQDSTRKMLFVSDPEPGTKGEKPAGRGLMCVGFGANECESDWLCTDQ